MAHITNVDKAMVDASYTKVAYAPSFYESGKNAFSSRVTRMGYSYGDISGGTEVIVKVSVPYVEGTTVAEDVVQTAIDTLAAVENCNIEHASIDLEYYDDHLEFDIYLLCT